MIRATIRALQRGYGEAQRDPESAVAAMVAVEPGLDHDSLAAQLDAVAPAVHGRRAGFGQLRPRRAARLGAAGTSRSGSSTRRPTSARAFDTSLVGPPADGLAATASGCG